MPEIKVSVQFAVISNLWAFRRDTKLNEFSLNMSKVTITFEPPNEDIGWAIEKHHGRVVPEKQDA